MGTIFVDNIKQQSSQGSGTITIGASGETVALASGVVQSNLLSPAWYINLSASQTGVTDNVATKVQFNSVEIDTDSMYDNTTNYRITIPSGKAGKYLVGAQVHGIHGNESNVNRMITYLQKNGDTYAYRFMDFRANPGKQFAVNVSAIIDCAVGDYLEVLGFVDSAGNQNVSFQGSTTARVTTFQGFRMGT